MLAFLIALVAGFATPHLDAPLSRPLVRAMAPHVVVTDAELRAISFMIAMLAASVVAELLHSGSAFWVILGGVIGYFALRLLTALQKVIEERRR